MKKINIIDKPIAGLKKLKGRWHEKDMKNETVDIAEDPAVIKKIKEYYEQFDAHKSDKLQ